MFLRKGGLFATGRPWCHGAKQPRIKQTGVAVCQVDSVYRPMVGWIGPGGQAWSLDAWTRMRALATFYLHSLRSITGPRPISGRPEEDEKAEDGQMHSVCFERRPPPSPALRHSRSFSSVQAQTGMYSIGPWSSGLQPPTESHHLLSRVPSLQMADLSAIII